ncbi:MAG: hypothetical protein ACLFR7_10185 [Opitutales bacterium]
MGSSNSKTDEKRNGALEWICDNVLPNCEKAVALVETGIERPLKPTEKVSLRYHQRLCPFCGCAEGKLTALRERYDAAERSRQSE